MAYLELDLYEGRALVGVVPFYMEGVRPSWAPSWSAFNFHELNLRTYVIHNGEPGVYFFSLDARAEAVDEPLKTGSEIERGKGLVFSMYGSRGNKIKK